MPFGCASRVTRREAIAAGVAAAGAGILWGTPAFAAPADEPVPGQAVVQAATSETAVLGVFPSGPVNEAVEVLDWGDFVRGFGGIDGSAVGAEPSLAAYALYQFFVGGGTTAWVVRLDAPSSAVAHVTIGSLVLQASNPGTWANGLVVELRPSPAAKQLAGAAPGTPDLVDLLVSSPAPGSQVLQIVPNLPNDSTVPALATVITQQSDYVSATAEAGATGPLVPQVQVLTAGVDATWSVDTLVSAILAQVGATASPSAPAPSLAPHAFNIMCIPDLALASTAEQVPVIAAALRFCAARQAFLIIDPPPPAAALAAAWLPGADATSVDDVGTATGMQSLQDWSSQIAGPDVDAAAVYYPWVQIPDPWNNSAPRLVPPSGSVAGIYAATDISRGVWNSPAGTRTDLAGVSSLADLTIDDTVNGVMNPQGINCLRTFPVYGNVVWGARTLARGNPQVSNFQYVSVRRLADFLQQSLQQSLRWAVFEPNGPALWSALVVEVSRFMTGLYTQGAFAGANVDTAFRVVCDTTTTSTADVHAGIVNLLVQFAPVRPAEFIDLTITLTAGSTAAS